MNRLFRRGFWLTLLRIAQGMPGPIGEVLDGHFSGGLADAMVTWPLGNHHRLGLVNAVPVAGAYCFGTAWKARLHAIKLPTDPTNIVTKLEQEFGIPPQRELRCAPIPLEPKPA